METKHIIALLIVIVLLVLGIWYYYKYYATTTTGTATGTPASSSDTTTPGTQPVVAPQPIVLTGTAINTYSGSFYIKSVSTGNYLTTGGQLVSSMSQATMFTLSSGVLSPGIAGSKCQVSANGSNAAINMYGYIGTGLNVSGSTAGWVAFPGSSPSGNRSKPEFAVSFVGVSSSS
jgi:hypothetical protein